MSRPHGFNRGRRYRQSRGSPIGPRKLPKRMKSVICAEGDFALLQMMNQTIVFHAEIIDQGMVNYFI